LKKTLGKPQEQVMKRWHKDLWDAQMHLQLMEEA
jgi:hypothetical protein